MSVNDFVLSLSLWAATFAMWLLVYMYGFWQMVRAAQAKQQIAKMWLGFLIVWIMSIPTAVIIKEFVL